MTVEAAVALPLFLLAVYVIWLFFAALAIQIHLQTAMEEVTGDLAQQSFLIEQWQSGTADAASRARLAGLCEGFSPQSMLSETVWKVTVGGRVIRLTGSEALAQAPIAAGAAGVSVLRSTWHRDGDLDLRVDYTLRLPVAPGIHVNLPVTQRSVRRCWTGSQSRDLEEQAEGEEIVYITPGGEVYHREISCTHLTLTVREVASSAVGSKRNGSGGAYQPCRRCAVAAQPGSTVFIAKEGDCYHTTRDCAGLKRSVESVPLSAVGGRRPCSKCGR